MAVTTNSRLDQARAIANSRIVTEKQALTPKARPQAPSVKELAQKLWEQDQAVRDQRATQVTAQKAAQKKASSGWHGLVGKVLDNPVVSTALKPLQVLDIPRRAIIATIDELTAGQSASADDWW